MIEMRTHVSELLNPVKQIEGDKTPKLEAGTKAEDDIIDAETVEPDTPDDHAPKDEPPG
jgi:hypothetical protein